MSRAARVGRPGTVAPEQVATWPKRVVEVASACAIGGGLGTLVGWLVNVERLTDWRNDGISMFPNAAVCAVASGLALLLHGVASRRARTLTSAAGLLVGLVGGLTLVEHLTGVDLGIDRLLFDRAWGQGAAVAPMRIGPPASLSFLAIGVALVLLGRGARARSVAAACGVLVVAMATLSLTGYLYGAAQMYMIPAASRSRRRRCCSRWARRWS